MKKIMILTLCILLLSSSIASAITINSVEVSQFSPGQEGTIKLRIENIFDTDVQDVSVNLDFKTLPFIPIGSSEESVDEIGEGDKEDFVFSVKAANSIVPGNYEIPYSITYELDGEQKSRSGTIGVQVSSDPELSFALSTTNPIVGQQGKISLKVINKGLFNARFVSVKILPEDFTLLSDSEVYIGEIQSDDFDSASFDVIFKKENSNFNAIVSYKNFNNEDVIKVVEMPFEVYSQSEALNIGLIQPNRIPVYIGIVILIIILIILWRWLRKRQRLKRSMQNKN
jgi:hypothetical protein